ncbi:MAG TPA: hypothetical protein VFJ21_07085, partial [Mycobacteriales bacterium]|nr:hypothetical protein [Mycobacteriales bacterium]
MTADGGRRPSALAIYVGALVAAAGVSVPLFALSAKPSLPSDWYILPVLAVLVFAAEQLQIRYQYRSVVESFTVMEAAIAPLLLGYRGGVAVLVVVAAQIFASALGRNSFIKSAFNVAQWALATSLATAVTDSVADPGSSHHTILLSAVAGLITLMVVNQVAFTAVLVLAKQRQLLVPHVVGLRMLNAIVSVCYGVFLAASYAWVPWTAVLFLPPLVLLHLAGRGIAAVSVDRLRLRALQQATHVLATSFNPAAAYPELLRTVRTAFEVRAADLALFRDLGHYELHRLTREGYQHLDEA